MEFENLRIIARLEIKSRNLIKGYMMEGLRCIGDPKEFIKYYDNSSIHEIFLEDISASLYSRKIDSSYIKMLSTLTNRPLSYLGGIDSFKDANKLFFSGVDKIYLNTNLFKKGPGLLDKIIYTYGSQSVGAVIQTKKIFGNYEVFCEGGRSRTKIFLEDWINELSSKKIGEIVLMSIDRDGTNYGPDYELIKKFSKIKISYPILYGGGIRDEEDIKNISKFNFDGVVISKSLHNKSLVF
tara:strand:+ start:1482 stop:2198 length:717 start_codon:yes stop_codon:yes gene_type:complete